MSDYGDLFPKPARLLFYDVEMSFKVVATFDIHNTYISPDNILTDAHMLTWAARWSDSEKMHSQALTVAEAKAHDDTRIVEGLAKQVRKADYTVAHNNNGFDHKILNGRVLADGLEPLGHTQTIDTLSIARSSFKLTSNRLGYIANLLGVPGKLDTDKNLWVRCYFGEAAALREMRVYNQRDVSVLEEVFRRLKPHAKTLPRLWDAAEYRQEFCPYCGSTERSKDGFHRTKANTFQRYRCECGRRYRAWQAIGAKKAGSIGL